MKNIENLTTPTRERTSVPITGLDLSTPDDLVVDGKCEVLNNMRYEAAAWRPAKPYTKENVYLGPINKPKYKILYKHPATGEKEYIASLSDSSKYKVCSVVFAEKTFTVLYTFGTYNSTPEVSHFGNVLSITEDATTQHFIFKEGVYQEVSSQMDLPTPVTTTRNIKVKTSPEDCTFPLCFALKEKISGTAGIFLNEVAYSYDQSLNFFLSVLETSNINKSVEITLYQPIGTLKGQMGADTFKKDDTTGKDLIYGNLCYTIAYRGEDGSILQASPLQIITRSDAFSYTELKVGSIKDFVPSTSNNYSFTDTSLWSVTVIELDSEDDIAINKQKIIDNINYPFIHEDAKISFSVPDSVINNPLFNSVAVYCSIPTQVYPLLKINEQYTGVRQISPKEAYNNEALFNQPLYLLSETKKADIVANSPIEIQLTRNLLESMVNNEIYTPNNFAPISSETQYDYNSRLHLANVSIDYLSYPHINVLNTGGQGDGTKQRLGVAVDVNGVTQYIMPESFKTLYTIKNKYVISIPDTSLKAFLSNIDGRPIAVYPFNYAYGNGFAYYTRPSTSEWQFPPLGNLDDNGTVTSSRAVKSLVRLTNRLQVSDVNNCFSLPFDLSYRIGSESNRIIALQSAAMELSDAKFGEFPLYAFTTEGIFALQAGATTLYSNIIPINYDVIINPSTIAINGAIMYITERGVHILSNQGSQIISTPIHKANGMPDIEFLRGAVFIHPKQRNEVLLYNSAKNKAFVYNLDAEYWSTRDMTGIKINTDELVDNTNGYIYNINSEDDSSYLECSIATRPIKLGNVEFKRLETIIPRINVGSYGCASDFTVYASNDGNRYINVLSDDERELQPLTNNPLVYRRLCFSAKYYKFGINLYHLHGKDSFDPSISHIDIEWYRRFSRRMR